MNKKASGLTPITLLLALFSVTESSYAATSALTDDLLIDGNLYFWNRDRDRKDVTTNQDESNLRHSTFNANLHLKSGYLADIVGIELGGYGAWEISDGGAAHPNEIAFSGAKTRWQEQWDKDVSGLSFYQAQLNLKWTENFWAKLGYIQPSGQSLLAPHWSLLPGTYRGFELGGQFTINQADTVALSYMWADKYKAPWYRKMYEFRQGQTGDKISYLHSLGLKYSNRDDFQFEMAYGQAKSYMHQFFAKAAYQFDLYQNPLSLSYQFYGAKDQDHSGANVYDGLAWLQGLTLQYQAGPVGLRVEGVLVRAPGNQGYFLQRMTPDYASSNGRLDIWWNSRSDFNADGERALFAEIGYDLGDLTPQLAGWRVATSYAYGWNAKPNKNASDRNYRLKESAWNLDIGYTVQSGPAKGGSVQLHYTRYNNHSNLPSWSNGFNNIFQDERDIKLLISIPFTIFNGTNKE